MLTRRRLGRATIEVTALSFGGAGLGGLYGPVPEEAAIETVRRAIDLGINYIEGPPFYGECEHAPFPVPDEIWAEVEERMRRRA